MALGSSLSGLNADRMARSPASRYSPERLTARADKDVGQQGALGLVIVNLQETQLDKYSTLRIFAELDEVMELLAQELQLPDPVPPILLCPSQHSDLFSGLPYNVAGELDPSKSMTLDLRVGARIKVTHGNFKGCCGVVAGKNPEGHYLLKVIMDVGGGASIEEDLLLASWFLSETKAGHISFLPLVQAR